MYNALILKAGVLYKLIYFEKRNQKASIHKQNLKWYKTLFYAKKYIVS